jgi:hypothetical protein
MSRYTANVPIAPRLPYPFAAAFLVAGLLCAAAASAYPQAQPSANRSESLAPCGRADPAYIRTANETGGIPMFLQRSEAGKAFQLVRESTRQNVATVLWATGTLQGSKTIDIPVDSVSRRITFAFSTDTKGTELTLEPPSGGAVTAGMAGADVTELNCGRIVTVSAPRAGEWRARIAGNGRFWLEARAQSEIYFIQSEFVHEGGRPGHEGLFRIPGQPVAGRPATLQVSLSAKPTLTTQFFLAGEDGARIQEVRLRRTNLDHGFLEFVGEVELPVKPFRVAVAGSDAGGHPYERFFAGLYHAESVEVLPVREFDELTPASVAEAKFTVRNIGAPRTFKITVTDTRGFVGGAEPRELALGADESGTVRVHLKVPAAAAEGTEDDVVIVAASTSGPATSNSAIAHFSVASPAR